MGWSGVFQDSETESIGPIVETIVIKKIKDNKAVVGFNL
jgi:hypothetical protein